VLKLTGWVAAGGEEHTVQRDFIYVKCMESWTLELFSLKIGNLYPRVADH
jgi:hypothetical protein